MLVKLKGLLILATCYFIYLCIGAGIFYSIEHGLELKRCDNATAYINNLYNDSNLRYGNFTTEELTDIVQNIATYRAQGIHFYNSSNKFVHCPNSWTFQGSFLFSGTIITTIGYGHVTPTTESTRVFCIFYALIGIPLFALLFAGLGSIFSQSLKTISDTVDKLDFGPRLSNLLLLTTFAAIGFTLFSLFPAVIFKFYEGWTYLDSVYFTIITLTTIGFGDFVAGSDPDSTYFILYKIMVYFWILFGLAFMATFINLLSDRFKFNATQIANRVSRGEENTKEDVVAEEEENPREEEEECLQQKEHLQEEVEEKTRISSSNSM